MSVLIIKQAGQIPPKAEQLHLESVLYILDCKELLDANELITRVEIPGHTHLVYSGIRSRAGTKIEVRISSADINAPYIDNKIQATFFTSKSNTRIATFYIRIYK